MADIKYEIEKSFGSIKTGDWTLEVNLVSWNGRPAKYEIRKWDENHEKMGKGVTLTKEEIVELFNKSGEILGAIEGREVRKVEEVPIPSVEIEDEEGIEELPF